MVFHIYARDILTTNVCRIKTKFGYNCWCNVYYLGPLFLTKLWHCQETFRFFDSSEETLKEKLGLKWVNLYCNCITRKQKKGRKIYKILFEECVTATLNRIIFITFESKAKNKKKKKILNISLNLLSLKFGKCNIFLILSRYYS